MLMWVHCCDHPDRPVKHQHNFVLFVLLRAAFLSFCQVSHSSLLFVYQDFLDQIFSWQLWSSIRHNYSGTSQDDNLPPKTTSLKNKRLLLVWPMHFASVHKTPPTKDHLLHKTTLFMILWWSPVGGHCIIIIIIIIITSFLFLFILPHIVCARACPNHFYFR